MLKNDKELVVAKEQVEEVLASNNKLRESTSQLTDPVNSKLMQDANDILLQNLTYEITEYEALVAHDPENQILLELRSAEEIHELPIKASIAFKITPQELTEICKQEEQPFDNTIDESENSSEFFRAIKILGVQLIDDLFFVAKMSNDLKEKLQFLRMQKKSYIDTSNPSPAY